MTGRLAFLLVRFASRAARRRVRAWWLLAAAPAAAPGGCAALRQPATPASPAVASVVRVMDGDTIVAAAAARRVTVRLLGIDTPETHRGPIECGAVAASGHLARIAPPGTRVRLIHRSTLGRHARALLRLRAYLDTRRGDLGERQLRAGLASVYRYRGRGFLRLDRYRRAQNNARAHRRATWSTCAGDFHSAGLGRQP